MSIYGTNLIKKYFQIGTLLPQGSNIYGFGENNHATLSHDMNYRVWGMFLTFYSVKILYLLKTPPREWSKNHLSRQIILFFIKNLAKIMGFILNFKIAY